MQRQVYISKFSQRHNPTIKEVAPSGSPQKKFGFFAPQAPSPRVSISPYKPTNLTNQLKAPTSFTSAKKITTSIPPKMKPSLPAQNYNNNYQEPRLSLHNSNINTSQNLIAKNKENNVFQPQSKIDMFKSANFSFIELMNRNRQLASHYSQSSKAHSQVSTPRLTPLRMFERNRAIDKMDMDRLE